MPGCRLYSVQETQGTRKLCYESLMGKSVEPERIEDDPKNNGQLYPRFYF